MNWSVRQMRAFISLVNDNHVDKNLKEISVSVFFGSIVNNRLKNVCAIFKFLIISVSVKLSCTMCTTEL